MVSTDGEYRCLCQMVPILIQANKIHQLTGRKKRFNFLPIKTPYLIFVIQIPYKMRSHHVSLINVF